MSVIRRLSTAAFLLMATLACRDFGTSLLVTERFTAINMSGIQERPQPVVSQATGSFTAEARDTATVGGKRDSLAVIRFELDVANIDQVTAAHIHAGGPDVAGPVMISLYEGPTTGDAFSGRLSKRDITLSSSFISPFNLDSLLARMRNGSAYVNVHTTANPDGEIRGQIQRN